MWWTILFQLCYDIPLMIVYLISAFIMMAKRSQYKSSFFSLFLSAAPGNFIITINSFAAVRIPAQVSKENILAPIYRDLSAPVTPLFLFFTFQLLFTYQLHMFMMALNRLSAIFEPIRYENIWSYVVLPTSLASYVLPLIVTYPLLLKDSKFLYIHNVQGYYLRFTGADIQPIFSALIRFMLLITAFTLIVNLLSMYLFIKRKSRNRAENALLFTSIAHFIIQSAIAIFTTAFAFASRDRDRCSWISRFAMVGYPYISDIATLSSPLFLIAFSRQLRTDVIDLLRGRFSRRGPLVRQLSRKSMKNTVSTSASV